MRCRLSYPPGSMNKEVISFVYQSMGPPEGLKSVLYSHMSGFRHQTNQIYPGSLQVCNFWSGLLILTMLLIGNYHCIETRALLSLEKLSMEVSGLWVEVFFFWDHQILELKRTLGHFKSHRNTDYHYINRTNSILLEKV